MGDLFQERFPHAGGIVVILFQERFRQLGDFVPGTISPQFKSTKGDIPPAISMFNRSTGKWRRMVLEGNTLTFGLAPAGGELLRLDTEDR